jgi:predicted dehydrogenase
MTHPIKLGIIGAGLAVKHLHWPALERLTDQYQVVAVADVDEAKAQAIADLTGATHTFTNYHDLLALQEIEAALISLPIHLTAPVSLDAARAGKHLVIEKPPGSNLEQARVLRDELARLPVIALVAENFRYRSDLQTARRLIREGAIGEIVLIRMHSIAKVRGTDPEDFSSTPWRQDPQYRGGSLLDGGVHHAAALRDIGGDVEWLHAFVKHGDSVMNGPTTISINLRFRSGALGAYLYSVAVHDEELVFLNMRIHGTTGTLRVRDGKLDLLRAGDDPERIDLDSDDTGGYRGEFMNFYEAVRDGKPVISTVEEGYRDMELILRGLDSAEQAQVILL